MEPLDPILFALGGLVIAAIGGATGYRIALHRQRTLLHGRMAYIARRHARQQRDIRL